VSSRHEAKYYKIALRLRLCVAVYELLTALLALELALPVGNSETRAFDAISVYSVQKRELFHVIAQAPLRQDRDVVV